MDFHSADTLSGYGIESIEVWQSYHNLCAYRRVQLPVTIPPKTG
jgi:hypothetical protein